MRRFLFLVAFIVMVAGVCGCGGDNDEAAAFDLPAAESCADLADMFVGSTQRMLDALGTRTDANMEGDLPVDIEAAGDEIGEWLYGSGGERVAELCSEGDAEFEQLVCKQASSLEALGEAAQRHMRDNFPCDQ